MLFEVTMKIRSHETAMNRLEAFLCRKKEYLVYYCCYYYYYYYRAAAAAAVSSCFCSIFKLTACIFSTVFI